MGRGREDEVWVGDCDRGERVGELRRGGDMLREVERGV